MPLNWWEAFPGIVPSPASRPRLLPGLSGAMPEPVIALQAAFPNAAIEPVQAPPSAFDPSYFSGAAFRSNQLLDSTPIRPPLSGAYGAPALDRKAAVQQAAAAIRGGADPRAVRARLNQASMANTGLDPSNLFFDLTSPDHRVSGTRGPSEPAHSMGTLSDPQMRQRADEFATQMRPVLNALPPDPAVHAVPLPNDRPFANPGQNAIDGTIVVRGARLGTRGQTQGQSSRIITLTAADVLNLKRVLQTEWVQRAGPDQARGIIDTILNRLASGHFGSTISAVVNQINQFSAINGPFSEGRHSVEQYPISRVSRSANDLVDAYLAERANGAPSRVGNNLNYANPYYSSRRNQAWIRALDGPVLGAGRAIHRHGTAPGYERYRPGPYSIVLPGPSAPTPPRR